MRVLGCVLLSLALLTGCGNHDRSAAGATAAPATSGTSTAPTGTSPAAPPPSSPPSTPPAATTGSGGSGGALGRHTRTVTTAAQGTIPSVTVTYSLYVPSGYDPATPIPVVFAALMGLTPWEALAEQETFVAIDFRDNDNNGSYDFQVDVLLLDAILQDVLGAYNVETKRLYYHGFSAGAHWGYSVVFANDGVFAGMGVHAGSMGIAVQQGLWPTAGAWKIPVAIRHGELDQVVPVTAGRADRDRLRSGGHQVSYAELPGVGHAGPTPTDAAWVWNALKGSRAP